MMRRFALLLALGAATAMAQPAIAERGQAELSSREVASVFKDVCVDKASDGFAAFGSDLAGWGYQPDGNGYYTNGVHASMFQLWRNEGRIVCTVFYGKTVPNIPNWTAEVMSAVMDQSPSTIMRRYEPGSDRLLLSIGTIDPSWVEHRPMESRDGQYLFRLALGYPSRGHHFGNHGVAADLGELVQPPEDGRALIGQSVSFQQAVQQHPVVDVNRKSLETNCVH